MEAELGGGPQDIEWALLDEKVVLLQARPITALPIQPVPIPLEVPPGYWTRETSHFPLPLSPFSDELTKTINSTLRRMATEFGLLIDGVEFKKIAGWEHVRVVPLGDREPPRLPGWLVPVAFRLVPHYVGESAIRLLPCGPTFPDDCCNYGCTNGKGPLMLASAHYASASSPLSDTALDAHLVDTLKLATDGIDVHNRLHGAIAVVLGEFAFTCRDLLGWDDTRMFSLLCGTSSTSTKPARALADVAALASPKVRSLLAQAAPANDVLAEDKEFAAAVAAYLREYGCRTLAYELAEPSLEERPDLMLALVRDQLAIGFDPRRQQELARQGEAAADETRAGLSGNELQRFERTLQRALMAYPVREDNEFFTVSGPRGLLRRAALEFGRRLASRDRSPRKTSSFCGQTRRANGWPTEPAPTKSWYAARGVRLGAGKTRPRIVRPGSGTAAAAAWTARRGPAGQRGVHVGRRSHSRDGARRRPRVNSHRHRRLAGPLHRHRTGHPLRVRVRPAPGRRCFGVSGDLAGVVGALPQRRGVGHRLRRHPVPPGDHRPRVRRTCRSRNESAPQSCRMARW